MICEPLIFQTQQRSHSPSCALMDFADLRRRQQRASVVPFLDENFMSGSPVCTDEAFKTPRLRQCSFDPNSISWEERLGGGLDGCAWKVKFGNQGPFVLKVFWDTKPPDFYHYYAVQRECQNAALFQMLETSVAASPTLVNANPQTKREAKANVHAFSDEGRLKCQVADDSKTTISRVPCLRQCYGWLKLSGDVLRAAPRKMWAPSLEVSRIKRNMSFNEDSIAIIYEHIEEGENDPSIVEDVLKFFWLVGFCLTISPASRNWKNGVLVDLSDVVSPRGYGWAKPFYGITTASRVLIGSPETEH